jgi:Rrf2 family protein
VQFSVGVEYALHSLFYLVELPSKKIIAIKDLANLNGLTETYLSKIFTKLRKAGIVRSVPGVNGGYELAKSAEYISFWDVIEAVEGSSSFFQCAEIRKNNIFVKDPSVFSAKCPCLIKVVMSEAEEEMRNHLRKKSLAWLHSSVYKEYSEKKKRSISDWFDKL